MVGENLLIMIFREIEMHIYIAIVSISYFESKSNQKSLYFVSILQKNLPSFPKIRFFISSYNISLLYLTRSVGSVQHHLIQLYFYSNADLFHYSLEIYSPSKTDHSMAPPLEKCLE